MIYLGIVEDESIMLQSIKECFELSKDAEVTITAQTMESFFEQLSPETQLNTLLLDINLPGMSGIDGIRRLRSLRPELDIVMLTNHDDSDYIFRALVAGAVSYISKKKVNPIILRDAIHTVHRGGSYMSPGIARKVIDHFAPQPTEPTSNNQEEKLTPRQQEIVEGLVEGLSYKEIAIKLDIGLETVRDHIKKIYRKLQVRSKAEVIRKKLDGEI